MSRRFGKSLSILLLLSTGLAGTGAAQAQTTASSGVDRNGRDPSVKPGDNFDQYANGGWRKVTEIPADRSRTGVGLEVFNVAEQRNADLIREASAANAATGTPQRLIADYYNAYMDKEGIEKRGLGPLKPYLAAIDSVSTRADLVRLLGQNLHVDVDPLNSTNFWTQNLFGLFVTQSLDDPARTVPYLLQGGLGMPDREYYLSDDPHMAALRTQYQTYIAALLQAAGVSDAAARAQRVMALEMKIAAAHADRTESEDVHKANNPMTLAQLGASAPGIDWKAYFAAAGLPDQQDFIIWHAGAVKAEAALVGSEPIEAWKDWLTFHLINQNFNNLPAAIDDLHFGFYGKAMQGTPQQRERSKRAIANVNASLGDAVGKIYVAKYFPASSKAEVQQMAKNILAAFNRRIDAIGWMTPVTKAAAKAKIASLRVGVGYPETWRSYEGLEIRSDDAFGNGIRAVRYETRYQLAKLRKPIDRSEWWMTPQTVNAVNLPLQNALNFPAAILEAPYFDPNVDAAANYGAIGAIIGHEISHSFDNTGAEFNADGKLANWWTPEDFAHFKAAGGRLVEQYNGYEPVPGVHVNGALTLGENIADVAGLAASYDAYRMSLGGKPAPVIDGLTGDQRFFLAFAQSWREKDREAALRQQLVTDGHSPGAERAMTVRNIDAWYDAFGVKPGDAMYLAPEQRVRIW